MEGEKVEFEEKLSNMSLSDKKYLIDEVKNG